MKTFHTVKSLRDFESNIAEEYNAGKIRFPIHLSAGNEQQLLDIFKDAKEGDYFFGQWRSHLHALLAGIPPEEVKRQILTGRSMTICSPEHRFFASAIVAGIIPIAVGVAWQIKCSGGSERVFCFLGDMTAQTGMAMECYNYVKQHDLPIVWIVEDNGKSVCTPTKNVWPEYQGIKPDYYYQWDLSQHYPHAGAGRRIQF